MRKACHLFLFSYFLLPFGVLLVEFQHITLPDAGELVWALENTLLQALFSALASLICGAIGATGMLWLSTKLTDKQRRVSEFIIILPSMVPTLFVLLSCLKLIKHFPFGIEGIVLVHSIINIGMVTVMIARLIEDKLGGMTELALLEGASRWQFYRYGMFSHLRKELSYIFLFVFSICFASFAVPLVVGGSSGTTIEVLIFEKIRIFGQWHEVIALAIFQTSLLLGFALIVAGNIMPLQHKKANVTLIACPWTLILPAGALIIAFGGLVNSGFSGIDAWNSLPNLYLFVGPALLGSLAVAIGTAVLTMFLLILLVLIYPSPILSRFLSGYIAPSAVVTAFALLLLGPTAGVLRYIKIIVGLTLMFVPALYRLSWSSLLESLKEQILVARTLGANWRLIFLTITLPQTLKQAGYLASIAGFWAIGEFALSGVIAGEDITLALLIKRLMVSYRLDLAILLLWILLISGFVVFSVFGWLLNRLVTRVRC